MKYKVVVSARKALEKYTIETIELRKRKNVMKRTTIIKVEKPNMLKSTPVITADQSKNKKGNNIAPAFCRVIFLVLKSQKKETAETDIIVKIISSTLYICKYSLCQTP